MAQQLNRDGVPFSLRYCARSAERAAFRESIARSPYASSVQFHYDDGPDDQRLDARAVIAAAGPAVQLYVCGPAGFIDWIMNVAAELQVPADRLHREYFSAAVVEGRENREFEVVVASTGMKLNVSADQSVARALIEAGVPLAVSCEEGICGSCITGILEGVPEHRDSIFTEEERALGDRFTPCCSRSKTSRLVLDL
jgi:vanillate O-demethylase ferredoxin subunit